MALLAVGTGGTGTWAAIAQHSSTAESEMVEAGVASRNASHAAASTVTAVGLPTPPVATTTPSVSTAPQPPGTATTATTATVAAPDTTSATAPPPAPVIPPIPDPTALVGWPPPPPPLPPVVIQTGPASWSYEAEGIAITASVSPATPRVGDTLTIAFTTGGEGDLCCRAFVFVGLPTIIGHSQYAAGEPCPPPPVKSGTASVVVSEPGPFTFEVHATRGSEGCIGPHIFTNVSLNATVQVLAA